MAITLTKSTILTWATLEDRGSNTEPSDFNTARNVKVDEMTTAGKTDGVPYFAPDWTPPPSDGLVNRRDFTDQTTAEEYVSFIMDICLQYGHTAPNVEYQDYPPPTYSAP